METRHSSDNPVDLASQGGQVTNAELWWNGPAWLRHPENWPENPVTVKIPASEEEVKVIREVLSLANDNLNKNKTCLTNFLNVMISIKLYTSKLGCDISQELKNWWVRRVQSQDAQKPHFEQTRREINLVPKTNRVLQCHGRIQGQYSVYLPAGSLFTRKLVQQTHAETLHGGVSLTMAAIHEEYWIPTLRQLFKSMRSARWGRKRFRALPLTVPPPTHRPYPWQGCLWSHQDRLRRTNLLQIEPETRKESIPGNNLLQSVKSSTLRAGSQPGN